ncbi:MAG: sugar phosphate isomerase/epimerase [Armatimonadetes bacterium]|nr:sugar phosphate isomerase/epimerase [Armatimonadota bacterium]
MRNRAALNLATLGPFSLEQKLYAAASTGFAAVGLSQAELEEPGARGRQELLLSDLAVAELEAVTGWMDASSTARSLALLQAEQVFATAADVGAALVLAWPSDEPVEPLQAATYFGELCRTAAAVDVRVGLEFRAKSTTIRDLSMAWQIVEMAECANGGVVIDIFEFHRGGSTFQMIEEIPGEKIFLAQISDAPALPPHELEDRNRLYPGTGIVELEPFLGLLGAKDYTGYFSLELHNEEYWKEDPTLVAGEGFRAMRRLDMT